MQKTNSCCTEWNQTTPIQYANFVICCSMIITQKTDIILFTDPKPIQKFLDFVHIHTIKHLLIFPFLRIKKKIVKIVKIYLIHTFNSSHIHSIMLFREVIISVYFFSNSDLSPIKHHYFTLFNIGQALHCIPLSVNRKCAE